MWVNVLIQRTKTTKWTPEAHIPVDSLDAIRISLAVFATYRKTHRSSVEERECCSLPKLASPLYAWGVVVIRKERGYQSPHKQAQLAVGKDRLCFPPPLAAGVGIVGLRVMQSLLTRTRTAHQCYGKKTFTTDLFMIVRTLPPGGFLLGRFARCGSTS